MDHNFEWQKQQVDERIQCALNCGAAHRMSKAASSGRSFWDFSLKTVPVLGIVVAIIGLLLSSCVPSQPAPSEDALYRAVTQSHPPSKPSMADRIHFQDRVLDLATFRDNAQVSQPVETLSMADRIHFQDRVLALAFAKDNVQVNLPARKLSMVDMIRFHDRLGK